MRDQAEFESSLVATEICGALGITDPRLIKRALDILKHRFYDEEAA
jgi:hypothetical protein